MDDVVSQLDITKMTTDQKIKILQIGLQYLLPKLKHASGEPEDILKQPVFLDFYTKKESSEGFDIKSRELPNANDIK